jgi:D-lactate dehydrogenase
LPGTLLFVSGSGFYVSDDYFAVYINVLVNRPEPMKILFFSAKPYDRQFFDLYNQSYGFEIEYLETHLGPHIVHAVQDEKAVCVFVNDRVNAEVIAVLASKGVKIIALRCAGFNNVDLEAARKHHIRVCRVPEYSPQAVAEHAVAMLLTLNRKTHKAYNRVREQNFSLNGLLGFNLFGKTVGVIGTGKIGSAFCRIMKGFGCRVIAYDLYPSKELEEEGIVYAALDDVLAGSDVISLHCPLNSDTHYLVNERTLAFMKKGVTIINTSRGGLINTADMINALKAKHVAYLGIDVYEQEEKLFFKDLSGSIIEDDVIQRLMSFPNVLVTAHQAFFTSEALSEIAQITLKNIDQLDKGQLPGNDAVILV